MADETETTDDTDTDTDSKGGKHDRHLEQAKAERTKLKQELATAKAELAKLQKAERDRETQKARKEQDFTKVEERLRAETADEKAKRLEAESKLEQLQKAGRRRSFAEEIAKAGGAANVRLVELAMADLNGIEIEPETVDKGDVEAALKQLKKAAPELFGTTAPRPPGRPGLNPKNLNDNEAPGGPAKGTPEWYRQQGELASRSGGVPLGYAVATGRIKPKD